MKHYVYKLSDPRTGEFYYGSRSCDSEVEADPYMGSYQTWVPEDESRLIKEIIADNFDTRDEAIEVEAQVIEESIDNSLNRNYYIPTKGFHRAGSTMSSETRQKLRKIRKGKLNPFFGCSHTEEAKQKIREGVKAKIAENGGHWTKGQVAWNKGISPSSESRKRMSESSKGQVPWNRGVSPSDVTRQKMSEAKKGKPQLHKRKPAIQYTKTMQFIKEWKSLKEADEQLNIDSSNIWKCCNGKLNTYKGFIWRYKEHE